VLILVLSLFVWPAIRDGVPGTISLNDNPDVMVCPASWAALDTRVGNDYPASVMNDAMHAPVEDVSRSWCRGSAMSGFVFTSPPALLAGHFA